MEVCVLRREKCSSLNALPKTQKLVCPKSSSTITVLRSQRCVGSVSPFSSLKIKYFPCQPLVLEGS